MKELLFRDHDIAKTSQVIRDLWILRRDLLKEKKGKQQPEYNQTPQSMQKEKKNPPQSGLPLSSLPQSRVPNPPQSGPPQSVLPWSSTMEPSQDGLE